MLAMTTQQPWAWAIAERYKPTENRGQNVTYRGEIAIHAGLKLSGALIPDPGVRAKLAAIGGTDSCWRPIVGETGRPSLALGAVVAVAQLVDCHRAVEIPVMFRRPAHVCCDPWGQAQHGTAGRPAYHLVLADIRPLARPVPARGMQSVLWPIKDQGVVDAIRAQLPTTTVGGSR